MGIKLEQVTFRIHSIINVWNKQVLVCYFRINLVDCFGVQSNIWLSRDYYGDTGVEDSFKLKTHCL